MEWAEKEIIRGAIMRLHSGCDYYGALDILCKLVDWPSFRFEKLFPAEEANTWAQKKAGENRITLPVSVIATAVQQKKKRGWPKGKKRGPRKAKEIAPNFGGCQQ